MSFLNELKRRNVLRVGAAYIVSSWLLIQVAETIFPLFGYGDTPARLVVIVLAIGFIPSLIISWVFEITPEGLKRDADVDREQSITQTTGKKLDRIILAVLALALAYFAFDKFVLDPARDADELATATQEARQEGRTEAIVDSYGDKSIAVLPFVNMSADPEQEYFSDGISEELLNLLARVPELRVISRSSAFTFKGKSIAIPEVARTLNVAHVLEGSVRKAGNNVRITVQLIEAQSDTQLWSETFDRTLDDIFTIQDEIATTVVDHLKVTLLAEHLKAKITDSEAYALFLQGRYFNDLRDQQNWENAVVAFKEALEIVPDYAEAWAGLSIAYAQQASWGYIDRDEGMSLAREAVNQALFLDESLPEAYASLGWIRMVYDFDWRGADKSYQEAARLAPGNATVLRATGVLSFTLGRLEEAIDINMRAIARDPLNLGNHQNLALVLMHAGRLEESEQRYHHVLKLNKKYPGIHMRLGQILLLRGQPEEALEMIKRDSDSWWQDFAIPLALYSLGRHKEAEMTLQEFKASHPDGPFQIAEIHAWRGEKSEAFKWLETAYSERDSGLHELLHDPFLSSLVDDERWPIFLRKIGLAASQN